MTELSDHRVAKSLIRRHLVLGGERELVLTSIFTTAVLVYLAIAYEVLWVAIPIIGAELSALTLFRSMGQRDPCMARVYWRRLWTYQRRYPPLTIPAQRS